MPGVELSCITYNQCQLLWHPVLTYDFSSHPFLTYVHWVR
jgi:hypothetical protein